MRIRSYLPLTALAFGAACGVSQDQETQIGADEAKQVEAHLPILHDDGITSYVNTLGNRIAGATSRADLHWQFAVVNTDVVNAFALPGGYIYVNRGVLSRASNASELASVLGHEIEHVVLRHSVQQMQHQEGATIGVALACKLTNVCTSQLGQAAIQVGGAAIFARFSRADEVQADEGGLQNVMRVGIDPRGMLTFFEKLLEEENGGGGGAVASWFADHPGTEDRIADVRRLLARIPKTQLDSMQRDTPDFQSMRLALSRLPAAPKAPADTTNPP